MAKMTSYLASKHVPEGKLAGNNPPVSQSSSQIQVKLPKINLPILMRVGTGVFREPGMPIFNCRES